MFRGKIIFISVAIVAALIIIDTKLIAQSKIKKMEQVYYTQEGKPYVLKAANKILFEQVVPALLNHKYTVIFQQFAVAEPPANPLITAFNIQGTKGIVPLMLYFSIFDVDAGAGMVSLATPFNYALPPVPYGSMIKTSAKILPNVELIKQDSVTPTNFVQYGMKYNQIVLSNDDFIEINNEVRFGFSGDFNSALSPFSDKGMILTATPDAVVSVAVLYFQFL